MVGPSGSQQTVLQAHAEATVSIQQEMAALQAAVQTLARKRTPYVLAVQAAPPEQKELMLQALADFDQQIAATMGEHKGKMRAALRRMIQQSEALIQFFE